MISLSGDLSDSYFFTHSEASEGWNDRDREIYSLATFAYFIKKKKISSPFAQEVLTAL